MYKEIKYCKCGCGEIVQKNYKKGHGRRGRKNSLAHNEAIIKYNMNKIVTEKTKQRLSQSHLNKTHSENTKKKMSEISIEKGFGKWMSGKTLSKDTKTKISNKLKGLKRTEETRKNISQSKMGEKNGFYGKTHSDEYKEKLKNTINFKNTHTPESIEKRRIKMIGRKASNETKKKMRISKIEYIKNKNGGICPMHNTNACIYFDELSRINNWNLQHALNGGEFYLSELGYFIDAYDVEKNIVVEYDESLHYDSKGKLKTKDVIRQTEIIDKLKCRFFRYNEIKKELYEVHE